MVIMKKIMLIGKINRTLEDLNVCLTERFSVNVCGNSAELVKGMMKIFRPDMIVVSAKDLGDEATDILDFFWNSFSNIHVMIIGTRDECDAYSGYFENNQFEKFLRPMSKNQLLARCSKYLDIDDKGNDIEEEKEKKLILIVDDSALSLRGAKAMVEGKYDVMVANSAKRAFKCMEKKRPDLILLDYEMPEMNGREFLETIRFDADYFDIPVIFLTAIADKAHIAAVLELEPAGYFLKPMRKDKVLEKIEEILG